MNEKVLVILGTAREESNTLEAIKKLCPFLEYELIDLNQKKIGYYSYDPERNSGDEFHSIAAGMLNYDVFVFATPVYWYSMSGQMKIFFDRLAELTDQYKPIGKALKGKKVYLIASGAKPELPEGFEVPFRHTAEYFDMEFRETFYQRFKGRDSL